MSKSSPYDPPNAELEGAAAHDGPPLPDGWVACPNCGSTNVAMPGFTWWGGAIGQKIISHVKCNDCSTGYHAKTGESNTAKIVVYQVVVGVIVFGLIFGLRMM